MIYKFGTFEFDSGNGELRKNGRAVPLEPQPAKALALLLSKGGEIVSREELRAAVWGADTHVDFDRGLAYCVSQIRTALGDSGDNPRFVQTVPKRGFKFIAPSAPAVVAGPVLPVLEAPPPSPPSILALLAGVIFFALVAAAGYYMRQPAPQLLPQRQAIIGVSLFDNETGLVEYDRLVEGLSDLVVVRLAGLDRGRVAVIGNAPILRQPRNIRNLKAVAASLNADYVLLGQLQKGEGGLRFITHFIRLRDEAHLKANRLVMSGGGIEGMEAAVVDEFESAVREHVLNRPGN